MSFISLFIALLLERFFDFSHLRNLSWYPRYQQFISQKLVGQTPYVLFAAIVLPIALGVSIIGLLFDEVLFGFIKLVFSVAVILYCFGPRNLWADIFSVLSALSSNDVADAASKSKTTFDVTDMQTPEATHRELINHFFAAANQRIFAIVFWYACLGLFGVVLYRLLTLIMGQEAVSAPLAKVAATCEQWLNWPVVRFLGLIFALGGNFARVFTVWTKHVASGPDGNSGLLIDCGTAALNSVDAQKIAVDGTAEKEAVTLFDRSLIITMVIVAVMVFIVS